MPPTRYPGAPSAAVAVRRSHLSPELLTTLIAIVVLVAWLPGSALADTETPDLSGTWELDEDLSEDPMQGMRDSRGGSGDRGGGGRGGNKGGGGMGGGRGGPPGGVGGRRPGGMGRGGGHEPGASPEEIRQRMEAQRARVDRLQIAQAGAAVRITYADDREQSFTTDNKKTAIETPFGNGTLKARWRDGGLVVRTKTNRRTTTETYYVTRDGSLLTVLVELAGEGPMGKVSFRRIYRPVPVGAEVAAVGG